MKPFITFKNREDFNEVSSWIFAPGDVIDIGHSEMVIIFKDNKTLRDWEGCILWNHIKEDNFTVELEDQDDEEDSWGESWKNI